MRIGRAVVGAVAVLVVVVAAILITNRDDDPTDRAGSEPTSECPSEVPAPATSVWGIEVDKGQHTNSVGGTKAWSKVAGGAHPASFTYLKVSEGERDPVDVNHFAQRDTEAAREVGITVGFVHWAVPGEPRALSVEQDAVAEARLAVRSMGGSLRGTLPPALGLGLNPRKLPPEDITTWVLTWLAEMERLVERPPVLVASSRFLTTSMALDPELAHYPLWLQGEGCVPAPWTDWTFRTTDSAGLPRFGFALVPGALVYAGSPTELADLASTGTGIGPGPAHAHAHRSS